MGCRARERHDVGTAGVRKCTCNSVSVDEQHTLVSVLAATVLCNDDAKTWRSL